ncbi:MAG TPA: glycosyltransferase family 39 protein [Flavobacteriales bacterium]|nr:glycosyltransferase family 39 protein [Flavobacteriales bacterium]
MHRHPLEALTLIALVPRLVAAFCSGGYFAMDDHFLVIEPAASWVDAPAYSTWLPWNQGADPRPSGHSFFYVGLHYLLFLGLKAIGMSDPKHMMVVVRLLHALWSLVVVRTGYRIALRLSNEHTAWSTGLLLALLCFMPFLSVRNLVETACIPFLMLGAWRLVRVPEGPEVKDALVAGLWIGLAVNVRFQTLFFAAGPGLALLLARRWRPAMVYGLGVALPLLLIQSVVDLYIWGRPFAEITEYVLYNLVNTTTYFVHPWYNHLLVLAAIFLPFLGPAIMFGFVRRWRPLVLWLPVILFIAIHSWFPNKQERFILPIVPLYLVLGWTAWEEWRRTSAWWHRHQRLWKGQLVFFWSLNILLLAVLSVSYSKRSRVEALYALRNERPLKGLLIEDSSEGEAPLPPLYYLGQWDLVQVPWTDPSADLAAELERHGEHAPDVVLFVGMEDLAERMARITRAMGPLHVVAVARPGLLDRVVHALNPVNRNETIIVMRKDPVG